MNLKSGSRSISSKILLLFSVICFSVVVQAQGEFLNSSTMIPPKGSGLSTPKAVTPSIFSPTTKPSTSSSTSILEKNNLQFTNPNQFVNPGDKFRDKLVVKEGGMDSKMFRKNQYLGDVKSKAEFVRISCRDFGEVDGDEIRILVNDKVMVERIFLTEDYRGIQLGLEKGFNKIDFEALNQGSSGPNTAQFQIYDDQGVLVSSNQWNLGTGFKATIIIVKE